MGNGRDRERGGGRDKGSDSVASDALCGKGRVGGGGNGILVTGALGDRGRGGGETLCERKLKVSTWVVSWVSRVRLLAAVMRAVCSRSREEPGTCRGRERSARGRRCAFKKAGGIGGDCMSQRSTAEKRRFCEAGAGALEEAAASTDTAFTFTASEEEREITRVAAVCRLCQESTALGGSRGDERSGWRASEAAVTALVGAMRAWFDAWVVDDAVAEALGGATVMTGDALALGWFGGGHALARVSAALRRGWRISAEEPARGDVGSGWRAARAAARVAHGGPMVAKRDAWTIDVFGPEEEDAGVAAARRLVRLFPAMGESRSAGWRNRLAFEAEAEALGVAAIAAGDASAVGGFAPGGEGARVAAARRLVRLLTAKGESRSDDGGGRLDCDAVAEALGGTTGTAGDASASERFVPGGGGARVAAARRLVRLFPALGESRSGEWWGRLACEAGAEALGGAAITTGDASDSGGFGGEVAGARAAAARRERQTLTAFVESCSRGLSDRCAFWHKARPASCPARERTMSCAPVTDCAKERSVLERSLCRATPRTYLTRRRQHAGSFDQKWGRVWRVRCRFAEGELSMHGS